MTLTPNALLPKVLDCLSPERLTLVLDLYRVLRRRLRRYRWLPNAIELGAAFFTSLVVS